MLTIGLGFMRSIFKFNRRAFLLFFFFFKSMSPAQKAFAESFKSDKRNVGTFPLMEFSMSGQEFKYTDVRTHHGVVVPDKLSFEMFWSGELEGLDQTVSLIFSFCGV
jgi:hypothetical protein